MAIELTITVTVQNEAAAKRLGDTLSQAFAKLTRDADEMRAKTTQANTSLVSGLQNLAQQTIRNTAVQGDLRKEFLQTGQAAQTQLNQFQQLQRRLQETEHGTQGLSGRIQGLAGSLSGLAAAFGVTLGVQGIVGFTRGIVEAGIAQQNMMVTLKAATGSVFAAGEAFSFARDLANTLGIDLQTTVEGFAQLTAVTQGTAVQGQATRDMFVALSQAARVVNLSTAQVSGVISALSQIVGKNTVSLEEMRQQLGDRLPQVLRLTAQEMKLTTAEFLDMIAKGNLLAVDVFPAMTRALDRMGKEAPAAAESVQASLTRMGNAWFELQVAIAQSGVLGMIARIAEETAGAARAITGLIRSREGLKGSEFVQQTQRDIEDLRLLAGAIEERIQTRGTTATAAEQAQIKDVETRIAIAERKIREAQGQIAQVEAADVATASQTREAEVRQKQIQGLREASLAPAKIKDAIADIDKQLAVVRGKDVDLLKAYGLDPNDPEFSRALKATEDRLVKQRQDLRDKLFNVDKAAGGGRATVASQQARGQEEILQASLNRQFNQVKVSFDEQRQLLDQELGARLQREPDAWAEIQRTLEQRRREIALAEAKERERVAIEGEQAVLAATLTRLDAEQAKRPVDAASIEANRVKAVADAEAKIQAARTQTAQVEQGLSQKSLDQALKDQQAIATIRSQVVEAGLEGRQRVIDAEQSLIQAQVEGRVLTEAQGLEQIKALQQEEFDNAIRLINERAAARKRAIDADLGQTEAANLAKQEIDQRAAAEEQTLRISQQVEQQELLNTQLAEYERFAERVETFLNDVITQFLNGTLNALDLFKQLLIRTLANIVSSVLAPFVTAISSSIVGGIGQSIGGAFGASLVGAVGGGAGGIGINPLQAVGAVGVANQLGIFGSLTSGINSLTQAITDLPYTVANAVGVAIYEPGFVGPIPTAAQLTAAGQPTSAVLAGVSPWMALGGLAGIGGGLYSALTAETLGGQLGGAIGAAGGATALAAALAPALGLSLAPILGPIGLAIAALAPILGGLLGSLGAPKGPRLAIGGLGGLGVGVGETGALTLTGELTSRILRAERVSGEQEIQAALKENITKMIGGLVDVINQVAIEPGLLLIPAQEALDTALRQALVLNSSSRENMARDIEDQLRTVVVQIGTFFLAPMLDAFRQLEDADLQTQIERLPVAVGQLATVFRELNDAFASAQNAENADVTRVFGEIQDRLDTFRQRLVEQTNTIAAEIVDGVIQAGRQTIQQVLGRSLLVQTLSIPSLFTQPLQAAGSLRGAAEQLGAAGLDYSQIQRELERLFTSVINDAFALIGNALTRGPFNEALAVILSIPADVAALNPALQEIRGLAQAFASIVGPLTQSIAQLEAELTPLDVQLTKTSNYIGELRQSIAEAGDDIAVALPLYDALREAILREMQLKSQQIQAQAQIIQEQEQLVQQAEGLITSLEAQIRGQFSPARQAEAIRGEIAALQAELATQTGAEALQTATEIQSLLTELEQLGETSNNLALVAEAQAGLEALIPIAEQQQLIAQQAMTVAEAQLIAMTGTADATEALRIVQEQALAQLQGLNGQLQALFFSSQAIQQSLQLPVPVVVVAQSAQQGGLVHLAGGGMVPAMLEPGEAVLAPMNTRQLRAAQEFNTAFPRFGSGGMIIPGTGSGDTVPALLPQGSFVMNRRATAAMGARPGYQGGGPVTESGSSGPINVSIHISLPHAVFRDPEDAPRVAAQLKAALGDPRTIKALADQLRRHEGRIHQFRLP